MALAKKGPVPSRLISFFIFVFFFLALRAPFLSQPLIDEEGLAANVLINHPAAPLNQLTGRIQGKILLDLNQHAVGSYELISLWGHFTGASPDSVPDMVHFARSVRWRFMLLHLCVWSLLFFLIFPGKVNSTALLGFLALTSLPVTVGGSIYSQTNSSVGFLLLGGLAAVFLKTEASPARIAALVLVGFLAKQEWSLAIVGALVFWGLLSRKPFTVTILLLGLVAGNYGAYLWAPENYVAGLHLLGRMASGGRTLVGPAHTEWLRLTLLKLPYLLPILVLQWLCLDHLKTTRNSNGVWFVFGLSVLLFVPYVFITLRGGLDYRFVLPSFAVSAVLFLHLHPKIPVWLMAALLPPSLAFLALYLFGNRSLISNGKIVVYEAKNQNAIQFAREHHCVALLPVGVGLVMSDTDFIGNSNSPEDAAAIARKHGGVLCEASD